MKKQYIKPQSRIVTLRLVGSVLQDITGGIQRASVGATDLSRQGHSFDDDEEEIEDSMWK